MKPKQHISRGKGSKRDVFYMKLQKEHEVEEYTNMCVQLLSHRLFTQISY